MKGKNECKTPFSFDRAKMFFIANRAPDGNISIFRPRDHAARFAHSASVVSIPAVPDDHFVQCVHLAVSKNAAYVPPHGTGASLYIRPIVFGSSAHLGLTPPQEYIFCVYVQPVAAYLGVRAISALIMEEFDRAAPMGTGSAKVGGNYAPVMRWSGKAQAEGYGITLHLDSKTRSEIEEFSTSAFLGLKKDGDSFTMVTPNSKNIVPSITCESCIKLAESFGWRVERREVSFVPFLFSQSLVSKPLKRYISSS